MIVFVHRASIYCILSFQTTTYVLKMIKSPIIGFRLRFLFVHWLSAVFFPNVCITVASSYCYCKIFTWQYFLRMTQRAWWHFENIDKTNRVQLWITNLTYYRNRLTTLLCFLMLLEWYASDFFWIAGRNFINSFVWCRIKPLLKFYVFINW